MDETISKLAKASHAAMRGEPIELSWLFYEAEKLFKQRITFKTNALWHTLVDAGRALNDGGEYALGGELFELILSGAKERAYPKIEFDALEGLACSWFYLGDPVRAIGLLEQGKDLAQRLSRIKQHDHFNFLIARYKSKTPHFETIRSAPIEGRIKNKSRTAHVSSLLKKSRSFY